MSAALSGGGTGSQPEECASAKYAESPVLSEQVPVAVAPST